jgi:uncharacterized membrane protein YbhN (UPF0104 family)
LGCRISWNALLGSVFVGILFNQLLPTAVGGDVLRAWRAKQLGATWETAIHSVLLDRATGVPIALIGAATLLPVAGYRDGQTTLEWVVDVAVGFVVAGLMVLWALARFRSARLPFMAALQNGLVRFHENAWTFAQKPGAAAIGFVLAGLNQLLPSRRNLDLRERAQHRAAGFGRHIHCVDFNARRDNTDFVRGMGNT